tara:strand:+ start:978 stop:1364 length:387 start_codon:yes stop_codon:yes gene_type:complete
MDQNIKSPSNRNFGVVFSLVFLIIGLWPLVNYGEIRYWAILIAFIFLILGLLDSRLLNPFNKIWFKFGILLSKIVSPIIMGIIFFLVVTPIGLLMRIFKKDLLNLRFNNDETYWIKKKDDKSDMKNQF